MMKLKNIKHIFWDLDHTLWDFDSNASDTLNVLFEKFELGTELKTTPKEFIDTYQRINEECWALYRVGKMEKDELRLVRYRKSFEHFGSQNFELADRLGWEYMTECPKRTKLMPGTFKVLDALKDKYKQHIITNGFLEVQDVKQRGSGLKPYFNVVVCSEEVGEKKPHPSVFKFALDKANAKPEESVMIGDNLEVDALGGNDFGMIGIWYNPHQEDRKHEVLEINHLEELLSFLL
jgi:putative hydrolase of the HAD superfamily